MNLLKIDKDDQVKQTKRLKIKVDELRKTVLQLEKDNDNIK